MIKVIIQSLEAECFIEIKQDRDLWRVIVIKSYNELYKEKGLVWHGETKDTETIHRLETLILNSYTNPTVTQKIIILDGVLVTFTCVINGRNINFSLKDFEPDTLETKMMELLLSVCNHVTQSHIFLHNNKWF